MTCCVSCHVTCRRVACRCYIVLHLLQSSSPSSSARTHLNPKILLRPSDHSSTTSLVQFTSRSCFTHLVRRHGCSSSAPMAYSGQSYPSPKPSDPGYFEPDPTLTNDDFRPTAPSERTFSGWEMASLLVDLGMAWWQGIVTVVAANAILLVPLVLTGHPGARYGVPFPVLARSSFGVRGAHVPALLRALAIFLLLPGSLKQSALSQPCPWLGTSPLEFACFIAFWLAQLTIVWKGIEGIRQLEKYSAPILIALTSCLFAWAYVKAGGLGHMLALSSKLSSSQFWALFFPSLTANISFWATLALNIPDFTRYAKSQRDQVIGQAGLPLFMGLFTFVGLAATSSTEVIFGRVISNPIQLLGQIGGLATTLVAILGISLATITTNIAANVVAPANALVNLSPSWFTFRRGALITALMGIAFQPWRFLQSSESFVYTWLVGYSALLGPIGGIILADYYLVRSTELSIKELYTLSPYGAYYYSGGYNLAAMASLVVGILPVIPGFLQKVGALSAIPGAFVVIYNNAWFFSFFLAGLLYWVLSSFSEKSRKSLPYDPLLPAES
ncbi:hypothetical protein ACJRO7_001310 [Eucalyptus globulus]|uniref:Uncharacterized protein n=1 Tax=Eucalyptus globulus TaxID=34317 RepID=A0ABD3LRP1_EUCGL